MVRKTIKRGLRKYTAMVPKTMRATKHLGKVIVRGATSVLNGAVGAVRQGAKAVDRTTAKAIQSLTQRKHRKHRKHRKQARTRKHHKRH